MIRETVSIQNLLAAAEDSIPNLDGHKIRVAERRILWSKLAQQAPAPAGAAQPLPPSATPQQVAEWHKPRTYEEWEEQQKYNMPISDQQVMDQASWNQQNPQDELGQLLNPQRQAPGPMGVAHVQPAKRPAPKPVAAPAGNPVAKPAPKFDLRQTMDNLTGIMPQQNYTPGPGDANYEEPLGYTPGPDDPNYTGASKGIRGLLKMANYLSKKRTS
jgi:hypothetical protein